MNPLIPKSVLPALKGRPEIPDHIVAAIMRPHDHEGPSNKPLWLLWKQHLDRDGLSDGPQLDTVADTVDSAFYHVLMLLEDQERITRGSLQVFVERIPANHRFASSIAHVFNDAVVTQLKAREAWKYKRAGD